MLRLDEYTRLVEKAFLVSFFKGRAVGITAVIVLIAIGAVTFLQLHSF